MEFDRPFVVLCRKREFDGLWAANGGNGLGFDPTSMPAPPEDPGLDALEGESSDSVVNLTGDSSATAASTCKVQISVTTHETET